MAPEAHRNYCYRNTNVKLKYVRHTEDRLHLAQDLLYSEHLNVVTTD